MKRILEGRILLPIESVANSSPSSFLQPGEEVVEARVGAGDAVGGLEVLEQERVVK